jgi:predicted proteasome-type protease
MAERTSLDKPLPKAPKPPKNIFIDFDIILNSNVDEVKRELDLLIYSNNLVYVWHKTYSVEEMAYTAKELGIYDHIWGYKVKDSFNYSSVDFIIDSDEKLVNRFHKKGIPGNVVKNL